MMVAIAETPVVNPAVAALEASTFAELKLLAEEIGANSGRSKKVLIQNILDKQAGIAVPEAVIENEVALKAAAAAVEAGEVQAVAEPGDLLPVKHLMLTMFEMADESTGVLNQQGVNERVDDLMAQGYEPIEFQAIGFSPGGHKLFYVFELKDKPKYTRSMHIMRLLTPQPNPLRNTITGFQADAYISAFIEQGWKLMGVRYNGNDVIGESTTGIFVIWMLVK